MYQLYLIFCVISGAVFGDSHEAKYIDLLPEEEKQEFLNRIARRIIEEIQNKDSPEQSQVEVTEDQLNQHHDYVRDLIQEESKNMRSERKDNIKENIDNLESSSINHELEKDKLGEKPESNENNQHIDLTLRENKHNDNNKIKLTEESAVKVIPVKVVYDEDHTKTFQSTTNNLMSSKLMISTSSDKNNYLNSDKLNLNNSEIELDSAADIRVKFSGEVENGGRLSKDHTEKKNSIKSLNSTDIPLVIDLSKEYSKYDVPFENKKTSLNSHINSNNYNTISQAQSHLVLDYNDTTSFPITVEAKTNFASNYSKENPTLSFTSTGIVTENITTTKGLEKPIKETENNEKSNITSRNDMTDQDKLHKNVENTKTKKNLRTKLEFFSSENRLLNMMARRKNTKKPYFVYEVSEEKPLYVQMGDSTEHEQPYVVPIYNFAPNNAYYNAYNHFGPNSDGNVDANKQNSRYDNEELYLRNGVEIDLNRKRPNQRKKENQYKFMERISHPHWAHVLNSLYVNKPYIKGNDYLAADTKRDSISTPLRQDVQSYLIDERTRRRKHKKSGRMDQRLPSSNEKDHPYNSIHKYADHIRAVKNLFYKQQKFGFLPPSPYTTTVEPSHKRAYDGGYDLDDNNDDKKESREIKAKKHIALDYYFGRFNLGSKREDDFDDIYTDSEESKPFDRPKVKDFFNKHNKLNAKHYPMVADKGCEGGCIKINLKSDNQFENYLNIVIKILKDMIYTDKKELKSYNWLLSTVDMEGAVKKLLELTKSIEKGKSIHPLDLRLLNYVVRLYSLAKRPLDNKIEKDYKSHAFQDINYIVKSFLNLLRRRIALPRNKNKKQGHKIKNPIRLWYQYYIRKGGDVVNSNPVRNAKVLRSFKMFLMDLEDNMFDLHDALKHIASITTYKSQNWYKDLKNIYLKTASKKELLEVILHLAASRLFSSIEETAKNAEDEYFHVNNNRDVMRRITNEFVFVLRVLEIMKKVNY